MKARFLFLLLVIALTVYTVRSFAQEQAPAPSFKDGDTWQFNLTAKGQRTSTSERVTGLYDLVYSHGQVKVYEVNGDNRIEMDIKSQGAGSELPHLIGMLKERPSLKFPFSVGEKWKYEFADRPAGAKEEIKYFVEVAVIGLENVTTPAGSFKAYKLVRDEQRRAAGRQVRWINTKITYFYSPETRSIVKSVSINEDTAATTETELVKYTPGK